MNRFFSFFSALALLIAAVAAFCFLTYEINRHIASTAQGKANLASLSGEQTYEQTVSSFLNDTAAPQAALASFVVSDSDVVSVIDTIEAAAKREKVAVTVDSVSVGQTTWKYHEPLDISLSAQGSFAALAAFATDLESLPQASRLVSVHAEASDGKVWFETFKMEFVKTNPL